MGSKVKIFKFRKQVKTIAAAIEYVPTPTPSKSPNLVDRWYYKPIIDLKKFKRTAVIDYLHLDFVLKYKTQPKHVQNTIEALGFKKPGYVKDKFIYPSEGFNKAPSTDQTKITLIFHDPSLKKLEELTAHLDDKYGLEGAPQISELEISVDFRSKENSETERAKMTALLMRHIIPKPYISNVTRGRPRFYGNIQENMRAFAVKAGMKSMGVRTGENRAVIDTINVMSLRTLAPSPQMKNSHPLIYENGHPMVSSTGKIMKSRFGHGLSQPEHHPGFEDTYYIGRKKGDVQFKIMHKIKDHQKYYKSGERTVEPKDAIILEEKDRRARIEITLRGEELNCLGVEGKRSLQDLKNLNFQRLQGTFFQFWHPTFKQADAELTYKEFHEQSEIELRKLEADLFFRAGALPVHEAQLVLKYLHEIGLPKKGKGRPRTTSFDEWSNSSTGHLLAYRELNKAVSLALGNLSTKLKCF